MLLRSIDISNFKPFREARIQLPPHGLVLVIGANNSGKSALLSALDVLAGSKPVFDTSHAGATSRATITAHFDLDFETREAMLHGRPTRKPG